MFWRFILHIVAGILGLWLASKFVPGVEFRGPIFILPKAGIEWSDYLGTLVFVGAFLGFLNCFIKPILNKITLPLRIITFNLFSFLLSMAMVWITDLIFEELIIKGIRPLFFATIIVWGLGVFLSWWLPEKRRTLPLKERET